MQTELLSQPAYPVANALYSAKDFLESEDERLVAETRAGSATAFETLVERYESRVFRLALRFAPTREDAEEIMQNAFLKAFNNLHYFRGDSRFYTWLVRITINEGLMKVRRRRTQEVSIDDFVETEDRAVPLELEDWGPNPEQQYSREELQNILSTTIARLPVGNRIVFQLRDVEGFSTEEVSSALHVSPTAVKARLRRARFQLRQLLNPYLKRSAGRKFMPTCPSAVAARRAA
jgi:RNA polymerase sigma-70 factor (ECF subfamily)